MRIYGGINITVLSYHDNEVNLALLGESVPYEIKNSDSFAHKRFYYISPFSTLK